MTVSSYRCARCGGWSRDPRAFAYATHRCRDVDACAARRERAKKVADEPGATTDHAVLRRLRGGYGEEEIPRVAGKLPALDDDPADAVASGPSGG